jgi:hypothetical protein
MKSTVAFLIALLVSAGAFLLLDMALLGAQGLDLIYRG